MKFNHEDKPHVILIGAGGHAHACIDVIEQQGRYCIAGLIGIEGEMHDRHFAYDVIATDAELAQLVEDYEYAVISVGQIESPDRRCRLYHRALELGFKLPAIIAPTAHVSAHARVGVGTIVMHGALINAGAKIGNNCIINTRALIEHDSIVEDHCHVSTGAILNGKVQLGAGSFVGSGSVVRDNITLGKKCVIGMGLSVRLSQPDNTKFTGH